MNENALKRLLGEVLVETARAEAASSNLVCERAFEDRLPEMFQARHEATEVELSEASADRIVAAMLAEAEARKDRGRFEFSPNGRIWNGLWKYLRTTLHGRAERPSLRGRLALAGLAAVAALVGVLVWNALQAPGTETPDLVDKQPPPKEQAIPKETTVPKEEPPVVVERTPLDRRERQERPLVVERIEVGRLTRVMGEPLVYGPEGGKPIAANLGTIVALGSRIETGDMDRTEIRLDDGSIVRLGFNTTLTIPAGTKDGGTGSITARNFELTSGLIVAKVAPAPDASTFTVKTPVATAEVLGTEFSIELQKVAPTKGDSKGEPKLRAVLQVKTGRVAFFNDLGRVEAQAMTESTAIEGGAPTEPQRVPVLKEYTVYFAREHTHMSVTTAPLSDRIAVRHYVYPRGWTGLTFLTGPEGEVRVEEVAPGSPALAAGLEAGDIVLALDGEPVRTSAQVETATSLSLGRTFELEIERRGQKLRVPLQTESSGKPLPEVPSALADRLYGATRSAISGDHETSLRLLRALAAELPNAAVRNNLGVVHETRENMGEAIRSYKEAVRLDPRAALYRLNLGLALKKIGNVSRSVEELETAVALAPSYGDAIVNLADAYALMDRFDDAVAVLRAASEQFPSTPRFRLVESRVLIEARRSDEAIQAAERAVEISPGSAYAHSSLGEALQYGERFEEAETSYRKAIELNPFAAGTHSALGQVLQQLGREEEAEAAHRKAVDLHPSHASHRKMLGMFLSALGRYQDAETEYREALRLDPDDVHVYQNLGVALLRAGRGREGERELLLAIELDPDYGHGFGTLGEFYTRTGRNAEAEPVLRKAIDLDPSDARPYHFLGVVLSRGDQWREAETMYRKAIELDYPDAATTYNNLGRVLFTMDRLSEAEAMNRKAIELNPKMVSAYDDLARVCHKQGRFQEAAALLRKANDLDPKNLQRCMALADLLGSLGEFQKAMAAYEDAVRASPEDPWMYAALGWSQIVNHRWEGAVKTLRKCLELEPKGPYALNALNNLGFALIHLGELAEADEALAGALKLNPDDLETSSSWALLLAYKGTNLDEALERAKKGAQQANADPFYWETLGFVHFKRGELDEAIEPLKRAAEGYGKVYLAADALVTLGQVYEAKKDVPAAIEAYRRALAIEPGNKDAAESLMRLGG